MLFFQKSLSVMRFMRNILCMAIIMVSTPAALGEEPPFTINAEVDFNKVGMGEPVRYTVKVNGTTQDIPSPQLPEFPGFRIQGYLPTSQNIYHSGTTLTVSKEAGAILLPEKTGALTIPPATVTYEGSTYKSNSIQIEALEEADGIFPNSLSDKGIVSATTDNSQVNKWLKGKLFLMADVSPQEAYIGEPVTLTYYLYIKNVRIGSPKFILPEPQYSEFIKQVLKEPEQLRLRRVEVENSLYNVAVLRSLALIPTRAGEFSLEPLRMACNVALPEHLQQQRRSRRDRFFGNDPFDSFFDDPFFSSPFGSNVIQAVMSSQPVSVRVKQLPTPVPQDFSGTVGVYTLDSKVDRTKAREDELVTLRLKFTGSGYVESIAEPNLENVQDFEVYSSKSKSNIITSGNELVGEKEFEFVLRSKRPGTLTIPSVKYIVFNPEKEAYETLASVQKTIQVTAVENKQPLVVSGSPAEQSTSQKQDSDKETIVTICEDINYIHTGTAQALKSSGYIFNSPLALWLNLFPALAVLGAFLIGRRRERLAADTTLARKMYAKGVAAKRLKDAGSAVRNNDPDTFFAELSRALRGYIADKTGKPAVSLTIYDAVAELETHGVDEETCAGVEVILETCDTARYAAGESSEEEMQLLYQRAAHIINSLQKQLR